MSPSQASSPQYDEATAIVRETKDAQDSVVSMLTRYLELAERMREFEDTFSNQILTSTNELFVVRTQRKRLEAAYRRAQEKVEKGEYRNADELREEIDVAVEFSEINATEQDASPDELNHNFGGHDSDGLDSVTKERIYRAFRRIVLPRVYPDTSDADPSEFEAAFAAFKSRDYVLMDAFVIRYRDEITLEEGGQLLTLAQLTTRLKEHQAAGKRLEKRVSILEREITFAEIKAPEQARKRMEEQGERLRRAIREESEKLHDLENRLASLVDIVRHEEGRNDG